MFCRLCYITSQITTIMLMAPQIQSFKTHTALGSVVFSNMEDPADGVHNEYFFGKCATRDKVLQTSFRFSYEELRGRILVGDWLDVTLEPDCIYIRSDSYVEENVKYDAQKFTFCICHITYNYAGDIHIHYYYEWYIPLEITKGLNWEIFFYQLS